MGEQKLKTFNWFNIIFISFNTVVALIGVPLYLHFYGFARDEAFLFIFFCLGTGLSITVGYHRLFSHATYKTNVVIRFLLLYFGAAAFEQSALAWSSQHRDHHRFVDTAADPYSIKKGFFGRIWVGWLRDITSFIIQAWKTWCATGS